VSWISRGGAEHAEERGEFIGFSPRNLGVLRAPALKENFSRASAPGCPRPSPPLSPAPCACKPHCSRHVQRLDRGPLADEIRRRRSGAHIERRHHVARPRRPECASGSAHEQRPADVGRRGRTSGEISKSRLEGILGAGGPLLDLSTSNGGFGLRGRPGVGSQRGGVEHAQERGEFIGFSPRNLSVLRASALKENFPRASAPGCPRPSPPLSPAPCACKPRCSRCDRGSGGIARGRRDACARWPRVTAA
jgi:hypothetical protein